MNLRDDIAAEIGSPFNTDAAVYANKMIAFLADAASDPVRLRAILSLIGLEVVGNRSRPPVNNCERFNFDYGYCIEGADCACYALIPAPDLVVRPQGEADHAGS